jgi:hypothetical protein
VAELTKKQEFIKSMFPDQDEAWTLNVVTYIHSLGEDFGTHKYDVWIAKEAKKDEDILLRNTDLYLIVDWASSTSANIFIMNFEEAIEAQKDWHKKMISVAEHNLIDIPEADQDRVIYITKDNKYFLYILSDKDLKYEGMTMNHCASGESYQKKVKNGKSIMLSLRDLNNKPHVTLEIAISKNKAGAYSGRVVQQYGNSNQVPSDKYRKALLECVVFMSDAGGTFMDMKYL